MLGLISVGMFFCSNAGRVEFYAVIKGCILKRNKCNGRRAYGVISVIVD